MAYQTDGTPPPFDVPKARDIAEAVAPPEPAEAFGESAIEDVFQRGAAASEQARFAARRIASKVR